MYFGPPSVSLGPLVLLLAQIVLVLLAAGVGLWALRRHQSQDDRRVAQSPTSSPVKRDLPEVGSVVSLSILPDPSWGWWPISGNLLLEVPRARSGQ